MLVVHPVPALELDVCPVGDGIWFDAGEVGALAEALRGDHAGPGVASLEKVLAHASRVIDGGGLGVTQG